MDTAGTAKESLLEAINMVKLRQLNELRKENEFCDLTLKCEDGFEIKVHKNVLFSANNYFKDLLSTPMKKKLKKSISLPDVTGDVLEKIVTFIYTSKFKEEDEDVEKIIKYAMTFQPAKLVEICSLALSESMTDHSCLKYWRFAGDNLYYSLEDKCLSYIISKADRLFETSFMGDLTIGEMRVLLADNRLHLQCDERKIFEHVWKWAEGKISEIISFSQVFSEVVDLFNYAELKQEFILPRIFFNDDLTENAELLQNIAKLIKQKYKKVSSRFLFYKPTQRLFGLTSKKFIIGLGEETIIGKETKYRDSFDSTTFENKLLICGGNLICGPNTSIAGRSTNSCELFEPSSQEWKKFPSMKTKKAGHQCSYLDNKIYACGGSDSKTVEIFDLGKGEWNYGPEMLANNSSFGLTEVNGALYAIGGQTDNVEILDPRTQKWNIVCSDFRRSFLNLSVRCASIGPCIYCFTNEKRYIFDTRSNKFTEEICWKDFNCYFNFCKLDSYIYGFGYLWDSATMKYSLNLVQYHLDGKQGFKKSYGLYDWNEITNPAIVSLYY